MTTRRFDKWMRSLRDRTAKARLLARLRRLEASTDLPGDVKPVGEGVFEMRFHFGPGYRIYLSREGSDLVLLLAGGDKSTQERDIAEAKRIKKGLEG